MTENSKIVKDKVYQEVAALAKQGMSNAAISRKIGRSPSHVLWMRKKLGLVNTYNQEREEKRQLKLDRVKTLEIILVTDFIRFESIRELAREAEIPDNELPAMIDYFNSLFKKAALERWSNIQKQEEKRAS